jgi:hypothetical protein
MVYGRRPLGFTYISECISRLGVPEPCPEDRRHVRVVDPGLEDEWTDRVHHHDRVVVVSRDRLD